jgi:hypothetical protein
VIHGELWLCSNGLLRRSLGFVGTLRHSRRGLFDSRLQSVDQANRPTRIFTPDAIAQIVAAGRRNRCITWPEISAATLKRGVLDHSLDLELRDGRREKFLWLKVDGGYDLLEETLGRTLTGRFRAIDAPIG